VAVRGDTTERTNGHDIDTGAGGPSRAGAATGTASRRLRGRQWVATHFTLIAVGSETVYNLTAPSN